MGVACSMRVVIHVRGTMVFEDDCHGVMFKGVDGLYHTENKIGRNGTVKNCNRWHVGVRRRV